MYEYIKLCVIMNVNNLIHYGLVFGTVFFGITMLTKYAFDTIESKIDDMYIYIISFLVASIITYGYYYVSKVSVDAVAKRNTMVSDVVDEPKTTDPTMDQNMVESTTEPSVEPNTSETNAIDHLSKKRNKKSK